MKKIITLLALFISLAVCSQTTTINYNSGSDMKIKLPVKKNQGTSRRVFKRKNNSLNKKGKGTSQRRKRKKIKRKFKFFDFDPDGDD